ncbi:Synaptotagmin-4 [Dirofilaria immitis]
MVAVKPSTSFFSSNVILYLIIGGAGFVYLVVFSIYILRRQRCANFKKSSTLIEPRTATALKYGNEKCPRGLKNSSSSLSSPLSSDSSSSTPVVPAQSLTVSPQSLSRLSPSQLGPHRGFINFTLHYSIENSTLQVNIISCRNLPELVVASDGQCLLEPYVKLQLLPEKQHRVKTRLVRASRHPQYDEVFSIYGMDRLQLAATSLHFAVIAFDRYSRDTMLGEAVYSLKDADLLNNEITTVNLKLEGRGKNANNDDRGQVLLSLCYHPTTHKVTVVLLKAKGLPKLDISGMADPYIKIYLLYKEQRISKKRSHVKKCTLSPVYNESFVFELPCTEEQDLDNVNFEIVVMDWDRLTKNELMGKCFIGSNDEHWLQVRSNPRRQIAEWHQLSI